MQKTEDVVALFRNYRVTPTKHAKEYNKRKSTFLSFQDIDPTIPSLEMHMLEDELISVTFLNNYFLEMKDDDFREVIKAILEGRYSIKKTLFRKKQHIVIQKESSREYIFPERLLEVKDLLNKYHDLPKAFTKKSGN